MTNQKQKANIPAEIAGWYGAAAIILAYILVSFGLIMPDSATYQLLNLTGAVGVIIIAAVKKDRQPVVLNIFWAVIALAALTKLLVN